MIIKDEIIFFILQIIGKIRWIHINVTTPSCTTLKIHQIAFKQYITFTVQMSVHSVGAQKDSDFKCCSTVCGQLLFFTCVPRTKHEAHVLPPASDDRSHSQITFIPNIGDGVRCPTFLGFFFLSLFFTSPPNFLSYLGAFSSMVWHLAAARLSG